MNVDEGSGIMENVLETGSELEMTLKDKLKKLRNDRAEVIAEFDKDILLFENALRSERDSTA